jgi:RsiW-degrading membrane proteinase PrsW (M82 family)
MLYTPGRWIMDVLAGFLAALAILGLGKATRQADTIPFYSTVLIVIALVYVLFAVMAGRASTIIAESGIAAVFVGLAVGGARWERVRAAGVLVAVGLVAHGAYDLVRDALITNAVVPGWWPVFCGVVDVVLGGWLGTCAVTNRLKARLPTA